MPCSPSESFPTASSSASTHVGVEIDDGYVIVDHNCRSSVAHIYAAGDLSGKLPLSSVALDAGPQDRRARHGAATIDPTVTSTTTRPRRRSSPNPRSPTWAWPRPTRSPKDARSGSPRCRSPVGQGAHQRRHARLRQDRVRSGDRRGARRVDRGSPRRRAHLGASRWPSTPGYTSTTSARGCSCTPTLSEV